jgi:5-methylcytosine-specific restriction protein A
MARAKRICADCPTVIDSGTRCTPCAQAKARVHDKARGSSTQRGYTGPGHKRFRRAVLTRDPICVLCRKAWANVADHWPLSRKQLIDAGLNPNDPTHGRGLCKPCHDRETAANQPGGWAAR